LNLKTIVLFCLFGFAVGYSLENVEREIPEMSVPELIQYWGYPVEEHWVTTEDGYILGLHRVPYGREGQQSDEPRPVAYLQHALVCSSAQWVFGPPNKSLGFILADMGYDVWMGNSRGNSYSRNHTYLDPCSGAKCAEFWNFGWHEGGMFDVPAGIDYALSVTNQEQVYYVGHSMGTTQYLVMLSMKPEYNEKIAVSALLAPPAFMSHATNIIFKIASLAGGIENIYHLFGLYEFLPHLDIITWIAHSLCGDEHPLTNVLCMNIGFLLLGFNEGQLNGTMIPTYLDHIPEGTSTRPFAHYAQLYLSANFEAYDFGETLNMEHYGQYSPPQYDLSQVTAATGIFKGDNDDLVSLIDVGLLVNKLPNVVVDHLVEKDGWTHTDYAVAMDADRYVYDLIIDLFANF